MQEKFKRPVGTYLAPERFLAFVALLVIATWLATRSFPIERAAMIGFDVAALGFLLSMAPLLRRHDADQMRKIAQSNDANRIVLLAVSGVVIVAILIAVGAEVSQKDKLDAGGKALV